MAESNPGRQPRVLVIRRRYLGDAVLLEPFVRNLRMHWPSAWIAVALDTPYMDALGGSRDLDEVIEIPVGRKRGWVQTMRRVASRSFDIVIDLAHNETSQAITLISRARRRIGRELLPSRIRRRRLYTDIRSITAEEVGRTHAVDLNNSVPELVGVPARARVPVLAVSDNMRRKTADLVHNLRKEAGRPGGPTLLIHPGSGARARRWPPAHFAYEADVAARRLESLVIILDGPSEAGAAEEVRARMVEPASRLRAQMTILSLFGLLTQVDLLLWNDSGPMRMAAAVGTPVCAMYGSQSRTTWSRLGSPRHRTFQADIPCRQDCIALDECRPTDLMDACRPDRRRCSGLIRRA